MPNPPKRHHFVPAFYLQGFNEGGGRDDTFHVLDLKAGKLRPATPNSVGFENHFYRVEGDGLDPAGAESLLADFEAEMAPEIKRIVEARGFPDDQAYNAVVNFVGLLAARGPAMRRALTDPMERMAKHILQLRVSSEEVYNATNDRMRADGIDLPDIPCGEEKRSVENDEIIVRLHPNHQVAYQLEMASLVVDILLTRPWVLLVADGQDTFICSDHPVALTWTVPMPGPFPPGFGLPGTTVTVPLTSRLALLSQFEREEAVVMVERVTIADTNRRTAMFADRFLCSAQPDFIWLKDDGAIGNAADLLGRCAQPRLDLA